MKHYLLDTCCISEFSKKRINAGVKEWFGNQDEANLYLSVITVGEILKGIHKLDESKKKRELKTWVEEDLIKRFSGRLVDLGLYEIEAWGKLTANCESKGNPIPAVDGLIASTCLANDLILVTRNVKDFERAEIELVNPWK